MSAIDLPFLALIPLVGYGVSLRAIEPSDAQDIYATYQDLVTIERTTVPSPLCSNMRKASRRILPRTHGSFEEFLPELRLDTATLK